MQWAVDEGLVVKNLIRAIDAPDVSPPVIQPYLKEEIEALLNACDFSRSWKTRDNTANHRPSANRDRGIILTLLDTGARASEFVGIKFKDLNFKDNSLILNGKGPGTDPKERKVYFGKRTAQALWKYLASRLDSLKPDGLVFVNEKTTPFGIDFDAMTRTGLYKLLNRLGERGKVKDVDCHRFRHYAEFRTMPRWE